VITCPNCGTKNEPGSSFCYQCGADIRNVAAAADPTPDQTQQSPTIGSVPPPPGFPPSGGQQQPPTFPPSYAPPPPTPPGFQQPYQQQPPPGFPQQQYDPAQQGWTPEYMSPPFQPKRRRWLWITLGLILGCILVCVIGSLLFSGSDSWDDFQTSIAEYQTEEAN
jgi:hypothetical protein